MYSNIFACLLQCCPQNFFLFPFRRPARPYNDDEFEKYEPRPRIIVDEHEVHKSLDLSYEDCDDAEVSEILGSKDPLAPRLRILAQYSSQKNTVIIKLLELQSMKAIETDELIQVRITCNCARVPKQQSELLGGQPLLFNQTFSFNNIEQNDITASSVRFRVYGRKGKERSSLRAQCDLPGSKISLDGPMLYVLQLNRVENIRNESISGLSPSMHRVSNGNTSTPTGDSRRSSMVDSCGRFCSQPITGSPELLISLCYDTDQNCLTLAIERGSSFGDKNKPPDTFIKITTCGEFGNELFRQKTDMVKGSTEPHYDHFARIQLHRPDLDVCTVRIEVWSCVGVLRRKQQLGFLALGLNSSSPDAQEHWEQMIQGLGITLSKWHPIHPPEE